MSEFQAWVQQHQKSEWLSYVDSSPYSESQWTDAMEVFEGWMRQQSRKCHFEHMLGYLNCCADYAKGKGPLIELSVLLKDMLEEAGYDGP